ncbi:HSP20-like chaperone [Hyaloscypha sp. PMI_1271]|nr:HSP20-like chaperone [Hyaloscypha sp. PMI_1271]
MAYNSYQQVPFWDFLRGFEQNGAGVDHTAPGAHPFFGPPPPHGAGPFGAGGPPMHGPGFPFGGRGGWGGRGGMGGGCRGRHCRRDRDGEEEARDSGVEGENTEGEGEGGAREGEESNEERPEGRRGRRGHHGHGRGGPHGFGARGGWGHHGRHGHGPHGRRGPPQFGAAPGGMGAFDLRPIFEALQNHPIGQHPWAQALRNMAEQAGVGAQRSGETLVPEEADSETFTPPVDIFSTERSYILHFALPGAKKEDVGVNFDSDKGVLNVAGVVYRRGDEEFLKTLTTSERKVGMFERAVKLPPGDEEKEEVDGDAITAKLEDGVLVVTVPKIEKDWTEVKRVDIE